MKRHFTFVKQNQSFERVIGVGGTGNIYGSGEMTVVIVGETDSNGSGETDSSYGSGGNLQ